MSQTQKIKNYLIKGNSITGLEALNLFGCIHLPRRILDIKEQGINIKSQYIKVGKKRVKEYWINRSDAIKLSC